MNRVIRISSLVGILLGCAGPALCQGTPEPAAPGMRQTTPVRNPTRVLWKRYFEAGKQIEAQQHNQPLAKRYYLYALTLLEQQAKTRKDTLNSPQLGLAIHANFTTKEVQELEKRLAGLYPTTDSSWSKTVAPSQQLALRQEQVNVLGRIAALNKAHCLPGDEQVTSWEESYSKASDELTKAKQDMGMSTSAARSTAAAASVTR